MTKSGSQKSKPPSQLIDARIKELGDWRGEMLSRVRALVKEADPEVVEEWKWRGTPVWSHDGIICTGETYKTVVKMTRSWPAPPLGRRQGSSGEIQRQGLGQDRSPLS
ncbi:MAG: hypothetical protein QOE67_101, partial [Solirubrobacteraceae bacterium]|nr:hypothetical protein [Solirubrobacteraceae bacterium]